MDKDNPLGLPPGSVRAIIAILLTLRVTVGDVFVGTSAFIVTAFGSIIAYYYVSKAIKEFRK